MIHFEIPKNQSSIIKVIGVGGGGSNAVNYMYNLGIEGVDFVVCNTDSQALALSPIINKIQLGPHLTSGLGAGANPEIGKQSCEESLEDISKILKVNTRMVFITAGMGGGTGTGGAPVVAKICRDLGILTVGIVTTPFTYEGRKRMKQAQEGIERMREHVDTVLIISNDKLRQQFGNLPFTQAFAKADDILSTAAKCITDVITTTGQINVDFADVCTVMKNGGVAILGSAVAEGENRALIAVEQALNSPLLNDNDIRGAKWILLNITSSSGEFEHTMDEAEAIQGFVQQMAGDTCDVILGMGHDPKLEAKIAVTVIATGFNYKEIDVEYPSRNREPEKISHTLDKQPGSNVFDIKLETKVDAPKPHDMSPVLMQLPEPEQVHIYSTDMPVISSYTAPEPQKEVEEVKEEPTYSYRVEETKPEEIPMKLSLKKDAPVQQQQQQQQEEDIIIRRGERVLTAMELEEKKRFEEQKRALEERAERLRNLSFKIKGPDSTDDMENVPAYMRRNVQIDNNTPSDASQYSSYSIGVNDGLNNPQATIQTINTYLEGKRPD
jgi:cell division protein FtsZ